MVIPITAAPAQVPAPGGPGTGPVIAVDGQALPKNVVAGPVARRSCRSQDPAQRAHDRGAGDARPRRARSSSRRSAAKKAVARCSVQAKVGKRVACKLVLPKRFAAKPVRIAVALKTSGGTATQHALSLP